MCSSSAVVRTLTYRDAREVDLVVRSALGRVVWQWSDWHPAGGPAHTGRLDSGRCSSWSLAWAGVDGQGRPLPTGDYSVTASFLAAEAADQTTTSSFTIAP